MKRVYKIKTWFNGRQPLERLLCMVLAPFACFYRGVNITALAKAVEGYLCEKWDEERRFASAATILRVVLEGGSHEKASVFFHSHHASRHSVDLITPTSRTVFRFLKYGDSTPQLEIHFGQKGSRNRALAIMLDLALANLHYDVYAPHYLEERERYKLQVEALEQDIKTVEKAASKVVDSASLRERLEYLKSLPFKLQSRLKPVV